MKRWICMGTILLLILGTMASGDTGWMSIPTWVLDHQNEQLSMYGQDNVYSLIGGQRVSQNSSGLLIDQKPPDTPSPSSIESLLNQADQFLIEKSYQEALDAYDQVIAIDSSSYAANYGRGVAFEGLGKQSEALDAYRSAVQYNKRSSSPVWHAYGAQGIILYDMERYLQAIDALDQAIQLSTGIELTIADTKELSRIFKTKGDALTALNRSDEADKAYQKANELNPSG